jgi:hypothetical protein
MENKGKCSCSQKSIRYLEVFAEESFTVYLRSVETNHDLPHHCSKTNNRMANRVFSKATSIPSCVVAQNIL